MKLMQSLSFDRQLAQLMTRDAEYFVQHPTTEYYIRDIASIEQWEAHGKGMAIAPNSKMLVYQIEPGMRMRQPFAPQDFAQILAIARQAKAQITAIHKGKSKYKRAIAKGFSRC